MSKNQSSSERVDSAHKPQKLTRRAIHKEDSQSEESSGEESENTENVPSNSKVLHSTVRNKVKIQHEKTKTNKKSSIDEPPIQDKCTSFFSYKYAVLIFISFVSVVLYRNIDFGIPLLESKTEISVSKLIEDMENRFKQTPITYRYIKSQLSRVVTATQEPSAPAIITLITNKGAETTASEFSQYLGKVLAPGKYISINDSSFWNNSPDDIKIKIDEEIESKYRQDQLNVIIVNELQKIPFKAAMLFHSYCDHEHSPYKRAVFLFIVTLDKIIPENASIKYLDALAMSSLRAGWYDARDDEVDSLITRVTVAVVNIK